MSVWLGTAVGVVGVLIFIAFAGLARRRRRGEQVRRMPVLLVGLALWAWGHALGFVVGYIVSETVVGGLVGLGVAAIAIAVCSSLLHIWVLKVQADRSSAAGSAAHEDSRGSAPVTVVAEGRDSRLEGDGDGRAAGGAAVLSPQPWEWPTNGLKGFVSGLLELRFNAFVARRSARIIHSLQLMLAAALYLFLILIGFSRGTGPGVVLWVFGTVFISWLLTYMRAAVQYHEMRVRAAKEDQRRAREGQLDRPRQGHEPR